MNYYQGAEAAQAASNSIGNLSKASAETTLAERAFDNMRNDIRIAGQAAEATLAALRSLMQRLGIPSMYGCVVEGAKPPPASGEIEDMQRDMNALIELNREIRGLAETIDARL